MHTILVAEDDHHIASLIELNLMECGYRVYIAQNGLEALKIFENHDISLILIDIIMPGLDGFNLLKKIREESTVPAIFITSRDQEIDYVMGLGLGADDYLTKPFSMEALKARIAANLRRCYSYTVAERQKSSIMKNGKLIIDTDSYTCTFDGQEIELNAKEIKLLVLFLQNPNKVFTAKQIYRAIWEEDYLYDDNTIRVHMSNIRSKIDPDKTMIKTIRGIGYKMVEVKT